MAGSDREEVPMNGFVPIAPLRFSSCLCSYSPCRPSYRLPSWLADVRRSMWMSSVFETYQRRSAWAP